MNIKNVFGILLLVLFLLLALSGFFLPKDYLEPWQKDYARKFDDPRISLVAHGLLAANGHNLQPWKIKLDEYNNDIFYLYADADRLAKEVDPFARQTMISQGTFLEYIKVAGANNGYKTEFIFFPNGNYDESNLAESMKKLPVAKITIKKSTPKDFALYDYMFMPDTNRGPYKALKPADAEISELLKSNTDNNILLRFFREDEEIKSLGSYIVAGAEIESSIHRIYEETKKILRINEYEKNKYRYGFSIDGQGDSDIKKNILQGLVTMLPFLNNEKAAAKVFMENAEIAATNTPAYAMIMTEDNSRLSQVKAGMLYSRLILNAHSMGLAMQPPSQVLEEYPEMKEQYNQIKNEYAGDKTIQILFRIGFPSQEAAKSMRQDVKDLMD